MTDYSEDWLVEQPTVDLISELGWETASCFNEKFGENGTLVHNQATSRGMDR